MSLWSWFVILLCWSCNDLLIPVGIPPSELSDTCKPSYGEIEINQIDRIEPRSSVAPQIGWAYSTGNSFIFLVSRLQQLRPRCGHRHGLLNLLVWRHHLGAPERHEGSGQEDEERRSRHRRISIHHRFRVRRRQPNHLSPRDTWGLWLNNFIQPILGSCR
jgi:hypothetical protein